MRFRAMGTEVLVLAVGGPPSLLGYARSRIEGLERRWSRFLPDSELSRLNAAGTRPARVGEDTLDLLERAVAGWRLTGGAFDPTVHDALVAAGYDGDIEEVRRAPAAGPAAPPGGSPGCAGVRVDRASRRVELAPGVRIDLGARARGEAEDGRGWVIAIEDPFRTGGELARVALADGAVATSSRVRRAWRREGRPAHHVIEPAAGRPAWSGLAQASAITRDCWLAEVLATAAMVRGPRDGLAALEGAGATGLLVGDDGACHPAPGLKGLLA
jgi:thiamine biosynthesis lipoprotein